MILYEMNAARETRFQKQVIPNEPLDLALVVTLARAAKPIREQVVRLQLAEHTRAVTLAIAENAGNRDPGVMGWTPPAFLPPSWLDIGGKHVARSARI